MMKTTKILRKVECNIGSIMIWKEYSFCHNLLNKIKNLFRKNKQELPYNRVSIQGIDSDWVIISNGVISRLLARNQIIVLNPVKSYNKNEQKQLLEYLFDDSIIQIRDKYPIDYLSIVNIIRPNTFNLSELTLDNIIQNKYYKQAHETEI